jgi:hypothetical protein
MIASKLLYTQWHTRVAHGSEISQLSNPPPLTPTHLLTPQLPTLSSHLSISQVSRPDRLPHKPHAPNSPPLNSTLISHLSNSQLSTLDSHLSTLQPQPLNSQTTHLSAPKDHVKFYYHNTGSDLQHSYTICIAPSAKHHGMTAVFHLLLKTTAALCQDYVYCRSEFK